MAIAYEEPSRSARDNTKKKCMMMTSAPTDTTRYKMTGTYKTEAEAKSAMSTMKECDA